MAVTRKYEAPLQVVHTQEVRDRIAAIAEKEQISQAEVIRDIINAGLRRRERGYTTERLIMDVGQALHAARSTAHLDLVRNDLLETLGLTEEGRSAAQQG